MDNGLKNVYFVSCQFELILQIFEENEISEIWITFPDPQIKSKREKHRLINLQFIEIYKKILVKSGIIHLKTDSEFMHGYTLGLLHGEGHEILHASHDIYNLRSSPEEVTETQTFYEQQYLEKNKAITYIQFRVRY